MDLLDKLKLFRDELNLLIEAEEKKRPYQSEVAKKFKDRIRNRETKTIIAFNYKEPLVISGEL